MNVDDRIAAGLPHALAVLHALRADAPRSLSDAEAMRAWELDFTLFAHAAALAEAVAHHALHLGRLSDLPASAPPQEHHDDPLLRSRLALLRSLHAMQTHVQQALHDRVHAATATTTTATSTTATTTNATTTIATAPLKPRLYRLADRLRLTDGELRAFAFVVLSCAGIEVPACDPKTQACRAEEGLFNCRRFSGLQPFQLFDFLSPSRAHFTQGLLEIDDEYATSYPESKFRAPREVLKAIYGGTLTLNEIMTLGTCALADVLAEEPGGALDGRRLPMLLSATSDKVPGVEEVSVEDQFGDHNTREETTDGTAMLALLSKLRTEDDQRVRGLPNLASVQRDVDDDCAAQNGDGGGGGGGGGGSGRGGGGGGGGVEVEGSGGETDADDDEEEHVESAADDERYNERDVQPYKDDMEYLTDGFEVVQEACKVYNFREKNSEEDRYTNTKRPVVALQREADAKLRKATLYFTRRLNKTKQVNDFMPRLELLVSKLKLVHFERMVILTLVGSVLSQSIRKTLRSDPSSAYETGITVAKLLRVHCDGDLREEIRARSYFYRKAALIRSGIVTIDVPYNMPFSDLGYFCCDLDHMVLDYVAGLQTELNEIMDSARCYAPKVDMDSVILPKNLKDLVVQRAENFETFRRLRKEVGFDDIVRYGKGLTLFFHGKSGTGKTLFANALASHLKKKLLVVDFASLNSSKHSNAEAYRIVFREAKVHGAIVFMDECDELFEMRERSGKGAVTVALREMETFDGIMMLATNRPQMLDEAMHRRIALSLLFEPPDANLRHLIWKRHVPKNLRLTDDVDLRALAIEFELTGGYIKNAVFQALAQAVSRVQREKKSKAQDDEALSGPAGDALLQANDVAITMEELRQACRLQARGDLKRTKLERRFLPVSGLDKLVATEEAMQTLTDIVKVEKVRGLMTTRWGFKDRQARSNCVLIFGPSGCGKTFAAGCLGFETGRPLQRLAASELHGSREGTSQIGDVFRQAAVAGAVVVVEHAEQLLFETSAQESTASPGLELLFHMQSFNGLVVMCCTTATSSAEAGWPPHIPIPSRVSSLLSYIVVLRAPDRESRLRLWRQLIPTDTPLHPDVLASLHVIANKYEFTGARISGCIRRGAAAAAMRRNRKALVESETADDDEVMTLADLEAACEAELRLARQSDGTAAWVRGLYV